MDDRISAPHVARLIGIKTPTLAKWRCLGKGPQGWIVDLDVRAAGLVLAHGELAGQAVLITSVVDVAALARGIHLSRRD